MSDWPDSNAPGVPLNPERDGWHWIVGWSDKLFVAEWDSDQQDYVWFDGGDSPSGIVENGWTYAGQVLTPPEADALRADNERLREMLVYIGGFCIRHDRGDETGRSLGHIAHLARAALEPEVKP
jgi:hypothetical protein